ncbi:MAG: M23 family metallopeptidase, partial [Mariprofundaceae bacterium]|nr:M23 family metallopeptidase [Mariprofundaceae bacterium]
MKYFSLMLVPDAGQVRTYRVSQRSLFYVVGTVLALLSFGAWGTYSVYQAKQIQLSLLNSQEMLQVARQRQNEAYEDMQTKLDIEKKKLAVYARNLGQMQASVLRLDSLGERLVEVSKLNKNEFDFGVVPALGGPRLEQQAPVLGLDEQMQHVNIQLTHLDAQLSAIDMVLQGNQEESAARPHAWPTEGGYLSSHYGMRIDPFTGKRAMHRGVDSANRFGAAVLAASHGVVVFAGKMRGYGYLIEIDHGYGYRTRYGHMSSAAVKAGDEVEYNQLIGRIGSTGHSTGPHLHFEVRRFGKDLNPST